MSDEKQQQAPIAEREEHNEDEKTILQSKKTLRLRFPLQ
jgi:hypothetical protein